MVPVPMDTDQEENVKNAEMKFLIICVWMTLARKISHTGIGLHSGKDVLITLCPAEVNTGIVFVRTDLPDRPEIPALPENVTSTLRATTLSAGAQRGLSDRDLNNAHNCFVMTE